MAARNATEDDGVSCARNVVLETVLVRKSYGNRLILDGISQRFRLGLTLLTGPSGAGKSTLLRLLGTAERPTSGKIFWNGQPLPAARQSLRASLGYAPQAVDLPEDLTAREFARHMAALKALSPAAADQQFLAITDSIGLHADINNKIATFSGAMRRRLIFAQALLGSPDFLALDEPTAELDRESADRIGQLVMDRAKTAIVIMTTHLAEHLAPKAVSVLRVENGKVVGA